MLAEGEERTEGKKSIAHEIHTNEERSPKKRENLRFVFLREERKYEMPEKRSGGMTKSERLEFERRLFPEIIKTKTETKIGVNSQRRKEVRKYLSRIFIKEERKKDIKI